MNNVIHAYYKKYNAEALLVSNLLNVHYLSEFTGSAGMLLLTPKRNFFFSDFRYMTQAKKQIKNFEIIEVARDSTASIAEQLEKMKLNKLLIEGAALTYAQFLTFKKGLDGVELIPILEDPAYIRMVKTRSDIQKLKKAIHVNKLALDKTLPLLKPGMRENTFAFYLETNMRKCGAEKNSFDTIVASGTRGSMPHGRASEKKIRSGELVTIDFGNIVDGYCSDETCTVAVRKTTPEQKKIYTIVKDAHDLAIEKIRPGKKGKEIDLIARDYISKKGFGKFFGHGLGHGIGLAVHERPMINQLSEDILDENMVFSIEPGIYIPKWGGVRIEDLVTCTSHGGEVLSEIDKNLTIIGG